MVEYPGFLFVLICRDKVLGLIHNRRYYTSGRTIEDKKESEEVNTYETSPI